MQADVVPHSQFQIGVAEAYQHGYENSSRTLGRCSYAVGHLSVSAATIALAVGFVWEFLTPFIYDTILIEKMVGINSDVMAPDNVYTFMKVFSVTIIALVPYAIAIHELVRAQFTILFRGDVGPGDHADIAVLEFAEGREVEDLLNVSDRVGVRMIEEMWPFLPARGDIAGRLAHSLPGMYSAFTMGFYLAGGLLGRARPVRQFMGCLAAAKFAITHPFRT